MPVTLCARCQNVVEPSDGSLMFCPHCGAPQVFLPESLREQAAEQARQFSESQQPARVEVVEEGSDGTHLRPTRAAAVALDPGVIAWPLAVRAAAITGLIAGGLGLVGLALPPVILLAMLWAMLAPVAALRIYRAQLPGALVNPQFGARLGLISALFVGVVNAILYTVGLVMVRYVLHAAKPMDDALQARWNEVLANQTAPGADQMIPLLHLPEFRVGIILIGFAAFGLFYLLATSLIGAVAGQMRSPAATRR